jgi:hypothetical protein
LLQQHLNPQRLLSPCRLQHPPNQPSKCPTSTRLCPPPIPIHGNPTPPKPKTKYRNFHRFTPLDPFQSLAQSQNSTSTPSQSPTRRSHSDLLRLNP